jgi:pimeloyl-ACP methyl ester carboxylesterase
MTQQTAPSNTTTRDGREKEPIILVPGGVNPAEISYRPLLEVINDEAQGVLKDLEVYATDAPPPNYSLELEAEGIGRAADAAGMDQFHLVGYSGGGACSLAFVTTYSERVLSLALIEPAWIGKGELTPEEAALWAEMDRVMALPAQERMSAFFAAGQPQGTAPPSAPPGPPPPWMAKRPAGLEAMHRVFKASSLQRDSFRNCRQPVYLAVGSLSEPYESYKAEVLAGLFPDIEVEVYEGRHHFDPPHRAEPERFARALRQLWARSEARSIGRSAQGARP